jgi:hypothetical protein
MTVRVTLNKTPVLGSLPSLPITAGAATLVETAADASNKNQFPASGNDLVIAHNTGVGSATVTVTSVADAYNRTGNITTYSLDAGDVVILGPFKRHGWAQTDGMIQLEASSSDVKFGVLALP